MGLRSLRKRSGDGHWKAYLLRGLVKKTLSKNRKEWTVDYLFRLLTARAKMNPMGPSLSILGDRITHSERFALSCLIV